MRTPAPRRPLSPALALLATLAAAPGARADVVVADAPISVETNQCARHFLLPARRTVAARLMADLEADTTGAERHIQCVEVAELPGAYVCSSFLQAHMNDAFTRIGLFMGAGKGHEPGAILPRSSHLLRNYKKLVAGHNMPGDVILGFRDAIAARAASEPGFAGSDLDLDADEREFLDTFLGAPKVAEKGARFFVVGMSVQNIKPAESVLSHEIYHAQYYLQPMYKEVVDRFWRETVSADDRDRITATLGQAYNTRDSILIDEFQAYLLQDNAEIDMLREHVPAYRDALIAALTEAGVAPIRLR